MKILMQQADAAGGGAGAAGAAAGGAGAGAAGGGDKTGQQGAGQQQTGAQQQGAAGAGTQQTGTTTNDGKGTGDTSQGKPVAFVPKLPEGMKIDDAVLREFNDIFADEKVSTAERQQKVIDFQIKQAQATERTFRDRLAAQPAKDLETLKADKDFGGANFQATVDGAKRIEQFAFGEELGKLLGPLGLQSSPVLLKGLARLARVIGEDSIGTKLGGGTQVDTGPEAEMRGLFPKSFDKMKQASRR